MTKFVYKPKRYRNGRQVVGRLYWGRYRLFGDAKPTDVPLKTADKRVAEKRLDEIVRQEERERAGLAIPRGLATAARVKLQVHLDDFISDLKARGRDPEYYERIRQRCRRLIKDCGWAYVKDVQADSFVSWRRMQQKAPRTLNHYRDAARVFLAWMVAHGRLSEDPLAHVGSVETRGRETVVRRALTDDEARELVASSGRRGVVYLVALQTGLRRGELMELRWGDVHLDAEPAYLCVRAGTTKNHKAAVVPLVDEVADTLRELKREPGRAKRPVFWRMMPNGQTVKQDLEAAGIEQIDGDGRRVDFHALRHTFVTNISRTGVSSRIRMEAARHSDQRLTDHIYTDASRLPTADAFQKLPRLAQREASHIASHGASPERGLAGHGVAHGGENGGSTESRKHLGGNGQGHAMACPVTECRNGVGIGEGGIRTPGAGLPRTTV